MIKEKGIWIAFEGIDGSGKSTLRDVTAIYLKKLGLDVEKTREPGGNPYSEKLRGLIFDDTVAKDGITQLLLFTAARRRNILEVVIPATLQGKIVLSDRSEGSTFAYQHYQFGISSKDIEYVNNLATGGIKPDYTFLLDVDPEIGFLRRSKDGNVNHFDEAKRTDIDKRRYGFLQLSQRLSNWIVINGNNEADNVWFDMIKAFNDHKILEAYGIEKCEVEYFK